IVAVKEASGNLEQIARICRDRPHDVAVLAGDDAWTLPVLALGGDGVVSVASNEIPGELVALCAAARAGDWETARRTHERWLPLFLGNFRGGPNPVPAKAALRLMGLLASDMVRGPLLPLDPDGLAAMAGTLRRLGLVEATGGRISAETIDETQEAVA
ncbi:MAG: dihydrodipicolinate synthase family protein, partial [Candidatus Limnocylindrales bacterium]